MSVPRAGLTTRRPLGLVRSQPEGLALGLCSNCGLRASPSHSPVLSGGEVGGRVQVGDLHSHGAEGGRSPHLLGLKMKTFSEAFLGSGPPPCTGTSPQPQTGHRRGWEPGLGGHLLGLALLTALLPPLDFRSPATKWPHHPARLTLRLSGNGAENSQCGGVLCTPPSPFYPSDLAASAKHRLGAGHPNDLCRSHPHLPGKGML